MYKFGLVGHRRNIELIEQTMADYFQDIELTHFEFNTLEQLDATIAYLRAQSKYLDGIIYTGRIPYELINNSILTDLPYVYIAHDQSNLQRTLLEANFKDNYDIRSTSIDSYTYESVQMTFNEFGLKLADLDIHIAPSNNLDRALLNNIYNFHQDCLLHKHVSFAITGISNIYERLCAENLPCLLVRPTIDAIKTTINHLLLQINSATNSESQIVVISIEIDMPNEYNLVLENEYQLLLEKTHVSEEVYRFTGRIEGAVVESGSHNYIIFSTRKPVEDETNSLEKIPLLKAVQNNTSHTVSMGIGFGSTARHAKYSASLGLNKAIKNGGNQAFIINDSHIKGPIRPEETAELDLNPITDSIFQVISDTTGISVNSIYRLHCIKEQSKKEHFTSKELAKEYKTSPRSMNRIILKLESNNYIQVVGTKIIGNNGRPTRILKLLF